jgi:5'-nucleotidase
MLIGQKWESAAEVAGAFVGGLVAAMPAEPVVVNLNVPNLDVADIKGWRRGRIGLEPPRRVSSAVLEPMIGHDNAYTVSMQWGDALSLPPDTDGGLVETGYVSLTYLTRLADDARTDLDPLHAGLDRLIVEESAR